MKWWLKIINKTSLKSLGPDLMKKIYVPVVERFATSVVILEASYNRYAVIDIYVDDECVLWEHKVRA